MPLTPGARLGPYEILSALGAGGMGEVYRARDTRLQRDVAIKVLPESVVHDPDRLARFQREAQVLASLNHPNIAHLHGLEESGGIRALVMELVEGEDLSRKIEGQRAKGIGLPLDEALPIAKQIVDALEAAHEQGVIHRDLKPANIKVRPDGTVKVLDFGLAKAMDPVAQAFGPAGSVGSPEGLRYDSPTVTTPAMTQAGVILGTAAYMSPEQARGKPVDRRADIWAFGCVLYEMLTGTRAFEGDNVSETLARVIEREPDWARLPATLSPALRTYITRCLQKDPRQRVQAIGDVRLALEGAFEAAVAQTVAPAVAAPRRGIPLVGAAIVASGALVGTLVWIGMRSGEPAPPPVSRTQVAPSGAAALSIYWLNRDLALTPDGSRLVYVGNRGTQLFVRALDALEPVAVFTGQPSGPFVSPDGHWIGFLDGRGLLKKVAVAGGPAVTVATLDTAGPTGATWGPDDAIIFATASVETGLQRVSAGGGPMTVLTRPDRAQGEADHFWPEMLPGGRALLFTITALTGGLDAAQVAVLDLQTGKHRVLLRGGTHAHYVPSGHLIYAAAGSLRAVPFDLARLETRGTPVTVVPDVVTTINGGVDAVVAGNGTLAYVAGTVEGAARTLVWVDRQGHETPIGAPPRPYLFPTLSPDGTRVAVYANDQEHDVWLWDLGRTTLTRLTFTPGIDGIMVWTPDGRRMIFTSERTGVRNLFWQAADGSSAVEPLTESSNTQYPTGVSPDGRRLIFTEENPRTNNDVMRIELDGLRPSTGSGRGEHVEPRRVSPLVQSPLNERNGILSPDGRWLAYEANDTGRFEVYVRPYPDVNSGHWEVSNAGGTRPIWTRSGKELIYVSPTGALMRVGVAQSPAWAATTPTLVVKEGYYTNPSWWGRSYDISADGQRFLMIKEGATDGTAAPPSIIVVQHWVEELKRLVPTKP
jgi:serine/threonine-protein kinase